MSAFLDSLTPDQRTLHDAMCDSAYMAGVAAGWNAANSKDPNSEMARIVNSRSGHLSGYAKARAALESGG